MLPSWWLERRVMSKYFSQPNFLTEQLDASGYHWNNSHNFKIRVIVEEFFRELDTKGLTEQEAQELFRIIYLLGSSMSLAPEGHRIARHMTWVPYREGFDRPGDMCRIKLDAFDGDMVGLNGKVGLISRVLSNGKVAVYLRTFAASVQVEPSLVEVVRRKKF